jgi:hypothetical protein
MQAGMQHYLPPKGVFDPLELAIMKKALDAVWGEISASNLVNCRKDDALRRAVCLKLFSLVRTRPSDPDELRDLVLSAVAAD